MKTWTIAALVVGLAGVAHAQVITGTLEGRAKDQQGSVLPGVTVTARNSATGASIVAVTSGEGLYRMPFLPPGSYDVRAELSGFRTETRQGVAVRVNDSSVVDFDLAVAAVSETITVQATAASIQVTRSELKRTYDEATLKEVPIATSDATGRNVYGVATKAPSGLKSAKTTSWACSRAGPCAAPVAASHSWAVLSALAVTSSLPPG